MYGIGVLCNKTAAAWLAIVNLALLKQKRIYHRRHQLALVV